MEKTNRKKKVNRRVKKTIRKTFGMLFLISALLIAAIPVQNLEAQTADVKVTIDDTNSKIPVVETTDEIYTTGDGIYQFAYISPNDSGQNKIAVILGYNSGYLEGGYLEIPDTVNAYAKFSDNFGSNSGYTAVSKNGKPLFYEKIEPKKDPATGEIIYETEEVEQDILDEEGNPTGEKETVTIVTDRPVYVTNYYPCFYEDRSNWEALNLEEFYVRSGGDGTDDNPYTYTKTTTADNQWIKDAIVAYIGNQYLKTKTTGDGWEVAGEVTDLTSDRGIFANNGNITNLKVGKNLRGIGNYAFIGCTSLNSIDLGNGLDTIGNWAFANCLNITQINLDISSTITILGDHAFYNCQGMTQFTMPIAVQKIGDSAFEGCFNMEIIELCGNGKNVALNEIGSNVFKDCAKLSYLQLPATYMESDIDISLLKGCTSLRYVSVPNANANFKETAGNFGFEDFKAQVPEEFYFEGPGNSEIHTTATEYEFAFKYLDEDCYEIIKSERDVNGQVTGTATYRVNSHNELIYFLMSGIMNHVDMPNTIGPYKITVINSGSFKGNCNLTTIAIPSSVVEIKNGAFQGCHNLKNVIFKEPVNVTAIGENAFQTQMVELHGKDCPDETLDDHPVLNFVGRISYSSAPFVYAMDPKSKINIGSQYESYINFYSTWPESLIVKYNSKTDKNELIGYPSKDALLAADFPYMNEEEKDYYREEHR